MKPRSERPNRIALLAEARREGDDAQRLADAAQKVIEPMTAPPQIAGAARVS